MGSRHTVQNFLPGNTLAFASDLSSTINNTSLFQFSGGFTSAWNDGNSTFTITDIPEPSTYVAAIGLLALMLWPSSAACSRTYKVFSACASLCATASPRSGKAESRSHQSQGRGFAGKWHGHFARDHWRPSHIRPAFPWPAP